MSTRAGLLLVALLAVLVLAPNAAGAATPKTTLPDVEDEVMCVECGTVLNISTSQVADRQREFIQKRIDRGQTKEEIKAALVDEFGPDVLAMPDREGFNLAVYLVPAALGLIGLIGVVLAARRWRARQPTATASSSTAEDGRTGRLQPDQEQRLAAELAAFDR